MRTDIENSIRAALSGVTDHALRAACASMVEAARRRERANLARESAHYRYLEMCQPGEPDPRD